MEYMRVEFGNLMGGCDNGVTFVPKSVRTLSHDGNGLNLSVNPITEHISSIMLYFVYGVGHAGVTLYNATDNSSIHYHLTDYVRKQQKIFCLGRQYSGKEDVVGNNFYIGVALTEELAKSARASLDYFHTISQENTETNKYFYLGDMHNCGSFPYDAYKHMGFPFKLTNFLSESELYETYLSSESLQGLLLYETLDIPFSDLATSVSERKELLNFVIKLYGASFKYNEISHKPIDANLLAENSHALKIAQALQTEKTNAVKEVLNMISINPDNESEMFDRMANSLRLSVTVEDLFFGVTSNKYTPVILRKLADQPHFKEVLEEIELNVFDLFDQLKTQYLDELKGIKCHHNFQSLCDKLFSEMDNLPSSGQTLELHPDISGSTLLDAIN